MTGPFFPSKHFIDTPFTHPTFKKLMLTARSITFFSYHYNSATVS